MTEWRCEGQLTFLPDPPPVPVGPHPSLHGARWVAGAHQVATTCGHKARQGGPLGGYDDGAVLCLPCALERCPVCGPAGRNVCLDDEVA